MADYRPETKVYLCEQVPLDDTYTDTLDFADKIAQAAYFTSKATHKYTNLSYQRVNNSIANPRAALTCRVPDLADKLYNCNYMMFQNNNFGTKWFYAFIKQVNYISPECTEIVYEIDNIQTWLFDFKVGECYVEREHSSSDAPFENILTEPINVTEYTCTGEKYEYPTEQYITLHATTNSEGEQAGIGFNGGIFDGLYTACLEKSLEEQNGTIAKMLTNYVSKAEDKSLPNWSINNTNAANVVGLTMSRTKIGFASTTETKDTGFNNVVERVNTIKIVNKKLLNSQFRYFLFVGADGKTQIIKPEMFNISPLPLRIKAYINPSSMPNTTFIPLSYDGLEENWNYAIIDDELVQCGWATDGYTRWLQEHQNSFSRGLVLAGLKIAAGLATAGAASTASMAVEGTATAAAGKLAMGKLSSEREDAKNLPDMANGNIFSGSASFSNNRPSLTIYEVCADEKSIQRADKFLTKFGYLKKETKIPNRKSRSLWNYVKTGIPLITGSIPVSAMETIKTALNNGITFWHDSDLGNYNRNNEVTGLEGW